MMEPASKICKKQTDFTLCIQCQDPQGALVTEPAMGSYAKFLQFIQEMARYGDADFKQISERLSCFTATDLMNKKAKWHRTCYGSMQHCSPGAC